MTLASTDVPGRTAFNALGPALTPDGLLAMESTGLYELIDGRPVEKRTSYLANRAASKLIFRLELHLTRHADGDVLPEQSFRCFPLKPAQVRRPDIAFIVTARIPPVLPTGHVLVAPDLAVEVVSPTNTAYEVDEKLDDYRSAGVPLVWVVYPHVQVVQQHPLGGPIVELRPGDTLGGGSVLPGLAVAVAELFPPAPVDGARP